MQIVCPACGCPHQLVSSPRREQAYIQEITLICHKTTRTYRAAYDAIEESLYEHGLKRLSCHTENTYTENSEASEVSEDLEDSGH
jgi:uncharacterized protein YbaR (Trm112 family)